LTQRGKNKKERGGGRIDTGRVFSFSFVSV
jgi:hypothetical protein